MMEELAKLKDIKPPIYLDLTMQKAFIYASAGVGVLAIIALILGLYFWLYKKQKKALSREQKALEMLKKIDFSNTKKAVYDFSRLGAIVAKDNERFQEILKRLEKYKYKKEVEPLSKEDIVLMQSFIKSLKVDNARA